MSLVVSYIKNSVSETNFYEISLDSPFSFTKINRIGIWVINRLFLWTSKVHLQNLDFSTFFIYITSQSDKNCIEIDSLK